MVDDYFLPMKVKVTHEIVDLYEEFSEFNFEISNYPYTPGSNTIIGTIYKKGQENTLLLDFFS